MEELTDDDLTSLRSCMPKGCTVGKLIAAFDAQAAVIERVLAWSNCELLIPYERYVKMREALAAAPEHTGPDVAAARLEYETRSVLESKLAAANARVAELERDKAALLESNKGLAGMVDAANARADAAERAKDVLAERLGIVVANLTRDESEAAALREQLRQRELEVGREVKNVELQKARAVAAERLARDAQRRNTVVDESLVEQAALESRLSTATELLRRSQAATLPVSLLGRDLDAFLSTAPAPP